MISSLISTFRSFPLHGKKGFAVLIDPDKTTLDKAAQLITTAEHYGVSVFLVGGSLISNNFIFDLVSFLKKESSVPVVLFPASLHQIVPDADGILFLSLISGRNPEHLIGKHVEAAPLIRQTNLSVLPTGYILVDCGTPTTASYMSGTQPIPYNKPDIAACTAIAGEMLGLQLIYLDGGSGAVKPISEQMIKSVKSEIDIPLIVGGGIRTSLEAKNIWGAGADIIVIGNAIERDPRGTLIKELGEVQKSFEPNTIPDYKK